ncbi:MAG: type II secretion system protein GspC [Polyangiaceae bacterium]
MFPFVVGLAIGVAAYLQVVGLHHLLEATLQARPRMPTSAVAAMRPPMPPAPEAVADAAPILERNAFDSVTGPLPGWVVEHDFFRGPGLGEAGPCEGARVVLIAASSDGWSFATLVGPDGKPQLRREGDAFGDHAVTAIGWDRVWLARAGVRCQARLGGLAPIAAPRPAAADAGDAVGLRKIGPAAYEVDRQVLDGFLENPQGAFGRVRVVPDAGGVRLSGIRRDSRLALLGLQNGDRIETLNGMSLATPEEALLAYARLRSAERLQLTITRSGKKQQLDYRVR